MMLRIKELRHERGWTQADLAMRVGCTQNRICKLERGYYSPTLADLMKIAEAFGVRLTRLIVEHPRGEKRGRSHVA